ncbi:MULTISPECIES: alpha,alpha-trehalase TreF [Acetobacter]|uniref:Alpha,alpha-trehalase n=1 Tax=Acetobacter pasteurianus subsp. pasteurianus TaxID=481145 RepID=A0A1Y0Y139_ACEPA|nr:alpha,alpha-trehalase TreF [Acetobacter pasteurianus]AKR49256.1 trehalase [Acetobacter pasteurianus]ARW48920.1 Alpha,alpha-trehalase [Acetobacter pasteurianus subsp. pasteurianus]
MPCFTGSLYKRTLPVCSVALLALLTAAPMAYAQDTPAAADAEGAQPLLSLAPLPPGSVQPEAPKPEGPKAPEVMAKSKTEAPAMVEQDIRPPSIAFDGLFAAIHQTRMFTDPKVVSDIVPDRSPTDLVALWKQEKDKPGFNLKDFVTDHFTIPALRSAAYTRKPDESVRDYISGMWDVLTRDPDVAMSWSTLLPLPYKYIVPGGRFAEIYYWDSYFTMIGLYEDDHVDLMRDMVRDIASLINTYGHMPNGNRTYYLSRSGLPFFSLMLDLLASHDGQIAYTSFLPELQKEYDYWTLGAANLPPGMARHHVVRLPDGTLMFRHWDTRSAPRDESWPQDMATAQETSRPSGEVWRDLRAAAESGWDFSSRWLADGKTLTTIQTTSLLTIELNCLMVHLDQTLSHAYALNGQEDKAAYYAQQAEILRSGINRFLWNEKQGAYFDYNWRTGRQTDILSIATSMPLFLHQASVNQADAVAETLKTRLLHVGGLTATEHPTGQQWDAPNGWAPLEWMAVKGLEQYGHHEFAADIARRWMARVIGTFERSGVLLEKYDVSATEISPTGGKGGGEYPMQIGFGWTNGTLVGFMNRYPQNTRQVLDNNPLADQPSQQPLPPIDAWDAKGPEIPVEERSPLRGVPLSSLNMEQFNKDDDGDDDDAPAQEAPHSASSSDKPAQHTDQPEKPDNQ